MSDVRLINADFPGNSRRIFLINRKYESGLSAEEEMELRELQAKHGAFLDSLQPPPFGKLENWKTWPEVEVRLMFVKLVESMNGAIVLDVIMFSLLGILLFMLGCGIWPIIQGKREKHAADE